MKNIIFTLAALAAFVMPADAAKTRITVERPAARRATSFAIVIDAETYRRCRAEVEAYRDALDRDELAVYILSAEWRTPDEVRGCLARIYESNLKRMPLEGAVFIGDVPFVSVQNAQHMTTAFKMNERTFPKDEASVTSDRFYDDLHLSFEFIERDSINPLRFYYRLSPDSPQRLDPTFYSGRILYPEQLGGDKYEAIARYLRKAVAERTKDVDLDHVATYAGHGYNSDCLTAWMDERIAIGEMFPQVVRNDFRALTQLNFRMEENMKYNIFDQLARPEVDVMLFNEHGSPDKQHVSAEGEPETFEARAEALRSEIYYMLAREKRKPDGDVAGAVEYFKERYRLTDKFFEEFFAPAEKGASGREGDLTLDDLKDKRPQPRFVMFNACYNGSFHRAGYIAGSYIFSDGRTVAAQGNTVNVLQDRWTYEMLGLISHGVRIGQYNRLIATLEGHIIGDPTFRFASVDDLCLSRTMTTRRCDTADAAANARNAAYWRGLIDVDNADVRSLALRMLADGGMISAAELLVEYRECPFATTRMECLKLLARHGCRPETVAAVAEALCDSYEVVRRNAATYAWMLGAPELTYKAAAAAVNCRESQRVAYILSKALQLAPEGHASAAAAAAIDESGYPTDRSGALDEWRESVAAMQKAKHREMAQLFDPEAPAARRTAAIRSVRNNTYHEYVPQLIELLKDESQPVELRVMTAEALGWFTLSYRKDEIVRACRALRTSDKELAAEVRRTVNRLL